MPQPDDREMKEIEAAFLALQESDFDLKNERANGMERLYELTEKIQELKQPEKVAQIIVKTIERLADCDLGSPGPLIHTLENISGYESHLKKSIAHNPTPLTIWALNRIINQVSDPKQKEDLVEQLRQVQRNPQATEAAKKEAKEFLEFQTRA